jgi:hypothetical protein
MSVNNEVPKDVPDSQLRTITGKVVDFDHPEIGDTIILPGGEFKGTPYKFALQMVYVGVGDAFKLGWEIDMDYGPMEIRTPLEVYRSIRAVVSPKYGADKSIDLSRFTLDHLEKEFTHTLAGKLIDWDNPAPGDYVKLVDGVLDVAEWDFAIYLRGVEKDTLNPTGWVVDMKLGFVRFTMPLYVWRLSREIIANLHI